MGRTCAGRCAADLLRRSAESRKTGAKSGRNAPDFHTEKRREATSAHRRTLGYTGAYAALRGRGTPTALPHPPRSEMFRKSMRKTPRPLGCEKISPMGILRKIGAKITPGSRANTGTLGRRGARGHTCRRGRGMPTALSTRPPAGKVWRFYGQDRRHPSTRENFPTGKTAQGRSGRR